MKQVIVPVISNREVIPNTNLLWLQAPEIARIAEPGQFIMIRCGEGYDPLLRRPLSIHRMASEEQIALIFNITGQGTKWLAQCQEGDRLDLLGPLGNGFSIQPSSHNLLLIAGGIGIAPLVFLADKAIKEGRSVTILIGAQNASSLYPRYLLPPNIDVHIFTEDDSEGRKGMVTDFMADFLPQADQVFACGPLPMYHSIAKATQRTPKVELVQVSLEMRMGCGVGACYSCTINTGRGLKQVCQDGPVFKLKDILY